MPRRSLEKLASFAVVSAALVALAACVNDNVVYRDRTPTVDVPAAAAKFVGYSDTAKKQTVCGNCHVDQQTQWVSTAHASAWTSLQASGHASAACEGCHAVSELGNAIASTNVGYTATKDPRYRDVQCESCHGPGLDHVTTPNLANRPLASIAVDTTGKALDGCGECHTGIHEPFVDEWKGSAHGTVPNASHVTTNTDPTCIGCHTGNGALDVRFNVNTNYKEKGAARTAPQPITCAVCHDPHGNGISKQLRLSATTANVDNNLCMKCHQRRAVPDQPNYSRNSPHSPEGEILLGHAGWFPPSLTATTGDTIIATHSTAKNPKLCAGCHVVRWAVNDPKTGALTFQVTGHSFEATPCVDANGMPLENATCAETQKAYKGCVASGCHGTEAAARNSYLTAENRMLTLAAQLDKMIALVPKTEIVANDGKYTSAEGAQFNSALAKTGGAAAHNPFLIEQLLTASMKQLNVDYKIALPSTVNLNNILGKK